MTDKPSDGQHILTGILFICGAGILFPVMNGFAKFLGESGYNSLQVSWARAFGHILFMLAAFVPRFGLGMLRTQRLGTQLLRSALLMTSNLSFFFAIVTIPIAKAASISLTAPWSWRCSPGRCSASARRSAGWWRWAWASSAC